MADSFIPQTAFGTSTLWQQDPAGYANWLSNMSQAVAGTPLGQQTQAANDEARRRIREIEDRNYQLQVEQAGRQRDIDAATIGNYKATQKYNAALQKIAESKLKLEQERQTFDMQQAKDLQTANLTGMYNGAPTPAYQQQQAGITGYDTAGNPTFARQQFDVNSGLARDTFQDSAARGWAGLAASLTGPENFAQYKNLTSGVNANLSGIPGLANWRTGGQQGVTGFTPGQNAAPVTLGSIFKDLGVGGSGPMGTSPRAGVPAGLSPAEMGIYDTADAFAKNPGQAAPNWWESQDPATQAALKSAGTAQGHQWDVVMNRYNRMRWGGGEGNALAA